MSNDIDWSKAPEGATHWTPHPTAINPFIMKKGDDYFWFCGGLWRPYTRPGCEGHLEGLVAKTPDWTGTGLPPVGTVCEGNEYGEWVRLEVIAHYEGRAVCMLPCKERVALADPGMLRPIRTPEQSAAEKRERAIADIERVIKAAHYGLVRTDISPSEKAKHYAATLHNAGYRKTEQDQDQ